jgi:serine/threonine protein kinase
VIEVAVKKLQINDAETDMDSSGHDVIVKRFIYEASECGLKIVLDHINRLIFSKLLLYYKEIMQNFDHAHIIKLIGVLYCKTFGIVMELAKFGQLRSYLQNNKDQIEVSTLLLYCCQLNSAMTYLESMKYVHRYKYKSLQFRSK